MNVQKQLRNRGGGAIVVAAVLGGFAFGAWGAPEAVVALSQGKDRRVTVSYTLDAAACVTVSLAAKGVAADTLFTYESGDAAGTFAAGAHTVTYRVAANAPELAAVDVTASVTARDPGTPPDWMAVDLATGAKTYYDTADAIPGGATDDRYKTTHVLFRRIPAAGVEMPMGSSIQEYLRVPSNSGTELTRTVLLTRDYYFAVYETTDAQWYALRGSHNNSFATNRAKRPAENFTYAALTDCLEKFNAKTGLAARLPSEAQWEFACRAGSLWPIYTDAEVTVRNAACPNLAAVARYRYNGGFLNDGATEPTKDTSPTAAEVTPDAGGTAEVGSYAPNAFGLYDMLGNVGEVCGNWQESFSGTYEIDPVTPVDQDSTMVARGGSWKMSGEYCRAACRQKWAGNSYQAGFRLCVPLTDGAGPCKTFTYTRTTADPRIVTLDLQTNGVSIGFANLATLGGDVNRLVSKTAGTIYWRVPADFPQTSLAAVTPVVTEWMTNAPPDYMVLNLLDRSVKYYPDAAAVPRGVTDDWYKTKFMAFRRIHAAGVPWRMGAHQNEVGRSGAMETAHEVVLSHDYWIAVYELTNDQFRYTNGDSAPSSYRPSYCGWFTAQPEMRPHENFNWGTMRGSAASWPETSGSTVASDSRIGRMRSRFGMPFDLPTRAQWEYACRAGTVSALYTGEELAVATNAAQVAQLGNPARSAALAALARYQYNGGKLNDGATDPVTTTTPAEGGTAIVGSYAPNGWGLYDMLGNVSEWCLDWCYNAADQVPADGTVDPAGPSAQQTNASGTALLRFHAGGNWKNGAVHCRAGARPNSDTMASSYVIGCRLAAEIR